MSFSNPGPDIQLRRFRVRDIPDLASIFNRAIPDEPTTVEELVFWEDAYPSDNPRRRRVAETAEGQIVGYGECLRPFWLDAPGVYWVTMAVDPDWQRQGIGQSLMSAVAPFAEEQGAERLWASCRENADHAIRFLEQAGFTRIGKRFESALDLGQFDEGRFASALEHVREAGYEIVTLAQARQDDVDADRHLYDLYCAFLGDVPLPGEVRFQHTYESFRATTLDGPSVSPEAIFIARLDGEMVGMTALELLPNRTAITSATGILPAHRKRELATALKLVSFRYLSEHGYKEARSQTDTANPPILGLNEKLGYRRLPGWLAWEKRVAGS